MSQKINNPQIDCNGDKIWYNDNGKRHREDGPAIEKRNGNKYWYINGKKHREDGPAEECPNGYKRWWYNGEFICDSTNGFTQEKFEEFLKNKSKDNNCINPKIDTYGNKWWYNSKGKIHREDGPAIEYASGDETWCYEGELIGRSVDGFIQEEFEESLKNKSKDNNCINPKIDRYGTKRWYNDKRHLHREDGPAVECNGGYKSWWYNGVWIGSSKNGFTQEDFEKFLNSKSEREDNDMSSNNNKAVDEVVTVVKQDVENAAWRVAAKKTVDAATPLFSKVFGDKVDDVLENPYGKAAVFYGLGLALEMLPQTQDPRVKRLAKEVRILSTQEVMLSLTDVVLAPFAQELSKILNTVQLPEKDIS